MTDVQRRVAKDAASAAWRRLRVAIDRLPVSQGAALVAQIREDLCDWPISVRNTDDPDERLPF